MKGDNISERLLDFAVRVLRVVQALPKTVVGRHVCGQLVRAGTAAGANYEEARGAESRADFIHKVGVSWKEAKESLYWLKIIHRTELLKPTLVDKLIQEANELCAILARSRSTALASVLASVATAKETNTAASLR
ncbi:MAG TPA: four helix bundle protein [Gemmataceae bacterium]|nr:four helix bundle protein [Gemmataceae bacterium]